VLRFNIRKIVQDQLSAFLTDRTLHLTYDNIPHIEKHMEVT